MVVLKGDPAESRRLDLLEHSRVFTMKISFSKHQEQLKQLKVSCEEYLRVATSGEAHCEVFLVQTDPKSLRLYFYNLKRLFLTLRSFETIAGNAL